MRRSAPAALRNREPIAEVLKDWLPAAGLVLEVASGTGEHALYLARRFPALRWQPSDSAHEALHSIQSWREEEPLPNLLQPVQLDASQPSWPVAAADAVLCINMAHISPWSATLGLLDGGATILPASGPLILYGPWLANDVSTAPSNLAFDGDLRARDPRWGLRSVEELTKAAETRGLDLVERRAMPANNFMLLLRRMRDPR